MKNILHIEDNIGDIVLTKEAFKHTPYEVKIESASNGLEGLKKIENNESLPDLVLLDINMPIMDGKEFLNKFKTNEAYKNVPVVVLTTSNKPTDILECYNLSANAYVTKDHSFSAFLESIKKLAAFWLDVNKLPPVININ